MGAERGILCGDKCADSLRQRCNVFASSRSVYRVGFAAELPALVICRQNRAGKETWI